MDLTTLLPTVPSERTRMTFLRNIDEDDYIIYKAADRTEVDCVGERTRERMAWAHCTACERDMMIPRVSRTVSTGYGCNQATEQGLSDEYGEYWPGNLMQCPYCGEAVRIIHTSRLDLHTGVNFGWVAELVRVGGQAVVITWGVKRWLSKLGNGGYDFLPGEAYTVEEYVTPKRRERKVRLVKYAACRRCAVSSFAYTFDGAWRRMDKTKLTMPVPDCVVEPEEGTTAGTMLEKSGIEAYMRARGDYADRLIAVWLKHPNVENLAMQVPNLLGYLLSRASHTEGLYYYTNEVGDAEIKGVDWARVRPHEMLGLDKDEMKGLETKKPGADKYEEYMMVRQTTGERLTDEVLDMMDNRNLMSNYRYTLHRIAGRGVKVERVLRYCHSKWLYDKRVTVTELLDTWDMLNARIGRLTPDVMWPRNLMMTHDREVAMKKEMTAEAYNESIHRRFEKLTEYSWEDKGLGLCIRPAASGTELRAEGINLHHCVETYCERVASGQTAIFFIRKRSKRRESYFTLELNERDMTVIQNRGMRNCARTPDVEAFEAKWLEYAKKVKMNTEDKKNGKTRCYGA